MTEVTQADLLLLLIEDLARAADDCAPEGLESLSEHHARLASLAETAKEVRRKVETMDLSAMARQLVADVDRFRSALEFYANPDTYFAIGFSSDPPCGPFIDDFDLVTDASGAEVERPGKQARAALEAPAGEEEEEEVVWWQSVPHEQAAKVLREASSTFPNASIDEHEYDTSQTEDGSAQRHVRLMVQMIPPDQLAGIASRLVQLAVETEGELTVNHVQVSAETHAVEFYVAIVNRNTLGVVKRRKR